MALIDCPGCGRAVSEKAAVCPACGFALKEQGADSQNTIKCCECGIDYASNLAACPICGCPAPQVDNGLQKPRKKWKTIIAIAVLLVVFVIVGVLWFGFCQKAAREQYYNNMEAVTYAMLNGAADAEVAGNTIRNVWYNAIFEKRDSATDKYTMENGRFVDDFNDALANLFSDDTFIARISAIQDNQSQVTALMKELTNPPKEYEEAYSVLKIFYDNYLQMIKAVINPMGSLQSFSEDFNTYDMDTLNAFEKMELYLD